MEKIAFEIGHFRTFQTSLTLTLDRVIRHTAVYDSSTSIYIPNFVKIGKTFCGRRTDKFLVRDSNWADFYSQRCNPDACWDQKGIPENDPLTPLPCIGHGWSRPERCIVWLWWITLPNSVNHLRGGGDSGCEKFGLCPSSLTERGVDHYSWSSSVGRPALFSTCVGRMSSHPPVNLTKLASQIAAERCQRQWWFVLTVYRNIPLPYPTVLSLTHWGHSFPQKRVVKINMQASAIVWEYIFYVFSFFTKS